MYIHHKLTYSHTKKLAEALLYLKDHNVYACDRGNTFRYSPAEHGSAILAPLLHNQPLRHYNPATMVGLPSQRQTWRIAG